MLPVKYSKMVELLIRLTSVPTVVTGFDDVSPNVQRWHIHSRYR